MTPAVASDESTDQRDARVSPLELLHPDGMVAGVAVEGDSAPTLIVPPVVRPDGPLDLVVFAPSTAEQRSGSWLERMLDALVPRLTRDAVVYVLVRPGRRRRARRELRRRGLELDVGVAHVPGAESSRYLVPLHRSVARAAFGEVVAVWPRRRRILAALLRLPWGTNVVERLLPSVALVARKPAARPAFHWASELVADGANRRVGAVVTSGRAQGDRVVLLLVGGDGGAGSVVAKVRDGSSGRLEREAEVLTGLGSRARGAGASLPEPIGLRPLGTRSVLFETGLAGESAAGLLASRPEKLSGVVELLADWLDNWHRATLVCAAGREELESRVLAPAELLVPHLEDGARYLSWLHSRCEIAARNDLPLVATHNDLTMFNVLVIKGHLGVVDWEEGCERGFPLTDFFYAAVDAAAAAASYADRVHAFEACFARPGGLSELAFRARRRLITTTGMNAELAELAFHSCWLRHAANEQLARPGNRSPFLAIAQRLAVDPEAWASAPT